MDIVSSGSGFNQILQLACLIAWRKPALVLLDEPDAHLHSSVQAQLYDFLSELAKRYEVQVILSTHSRDLISQAPLSSIVPVDASRKRLEPLKSFDHLLLEYQRYGPISNVDLALLYQTRSCVFVEGPNDSKLLPRIAERCGFQLFTGPRQVIPFEFQGVDKLKFIPDLVKLFERLIGGRLRWGVIRDSDANIPEVKAKYQEIGESLGAAFFHQWERYSIENYLLDPELLMITINDQTESKLSIEEIQRLLSSGIEEIEDLVSGTFVTKAQFAFRDLRLSENPHDEGAIAATRYLRSLDTLEKKLAAYPGKKIFGQFVSNLQNEYNISIRIEDLIIKFEKEMIPIELQKCFEEMTKALVIKQ